MCFEERNKGKRSVTIQDSLKVLPFSVEKVAKAFNLPIDKLSIDYELARPLGYDPTPEEITYLKHDCQIVGDALKQLYDAGMTRMTAASNSLHAFRDTIDKKAFRKLFPILKCDADIRQSYRGGYTYCSPRFKNQIVGPGMVFDVNSLYPSRMRYCKLPYGEPKKYKGKYQEDPIYNLYVQFIRCQFKLKKNHVPTIQIKKSFRFAEHEYVEDSLDEEVILCLTNVDLDLFLRHYDVFNLEYLYGYKFMSSDKLFAEFIDHWMQIKIDAEQSKNEGMRTLAKLIMNSLYGKWAVSPDVSSAVPYFDEEEGVVKYQMTPTEEREPLYIPAASFITAYARETTINAVQANYDRFCYCDTDSIHILGLQLPRGIQVDRTKLGAWKHEFTFNRAKFLRAKCYMEYGFDPAKPQEKHSKVTVAGMSDKIHKYVTLQNFELGKKFSSEEEGDHVIRINPEDSNLRPMRVPGGIVLVRKDFTLQI